jgi:hypothetical protein
MLNKNYSRNVSVANKNLAVSLEGLDPKKNWLALSNFDNDLKVKEFRGTRN